MSVFDIVGGSEAHPVYQGLEASNRDRQYSFLESVTRASLELGAPHLTHDIVRALNHHAIAHLHVAPGQFRHQQVAVMTGDHVEFMPPKAYVVESLIGDFLFTARQLWDQVNPLHLGAYVLWKINAIHPFVNGNGRTARAACYFVICTRLGSWLGGRVLLPELLRIHRGRYIVALKHADNTGDLSELIRLLDELIGLQISDQYY